MLIPDCDLCDGFALWQSPDDHFLCDPCYRAIVKQTSTGAPAAEAKRQPALALDPHDLDDDDLEQLPGFIWL